MCVFADSQTDLTDSPLRLELVCVPHCNNVGSLQKGLLVHGMQPGLHVSAANEYVCVSVCVCVCAFYLILRGQHCMHLSCAGSVLHACIA